MSQRIPKMRRFKRPNSADQCYVRLSGERVFLGVWGSRAASTQYDRVVSEWIARGRKPKPPQDDATIAECCDTYTDYARDYYKTSPKSFDRVLLAMEPLMKLYKALRAAEFGAVHLRAVRETMINTGLALTTINARVNIIRRMLKYCASIEMIPPDPWHKCATLENLKPGRTVAKAPRVIAPVPMEHVEAIKPYVTASVKALIELQLLTGARSGELLKLKTRDIDRSGDVWIVEVKRHKNAWRGQNRTLCLGPKAQDVLRPFVLRRRPEEYLFQPEDYYRERSEAAATHRRPNQKPNPRITDRTVQPYYDAGAYRRAIKRACEAARIKDKSGDEVPVPPWHPHQLRHARAHELRKQYGVEAVRALLGHSSVMTTELYSSLDIEQAKRIAYEVG